MRNYKEFFRGKRITIMCLGLLGRGVGDAEFLAECGASLIVTDLKSKEELSPSLKRLRKYKNIKYTLGGHKLKNFRNRDMILKAAGVPLDSPYIAEAGKNKIPVEMDASLFSRFTPATIIGVTGTRGKSTVTHVLYEMLIKSGRRAFLGGNVKGMATLPLLKKVKPGDIIIMELDSWQLQGFGEAKLSPHIAIFTNFLPDHLNYYKGDMNKYFSDKANIFLYQKPGDCLVATRGVLNLIRKKGKNLRSKITLAKTIDIPKTWSVAILGEHNRTNIALAKKAAEILGVGKRTIKNVAESFFGIPGRLEHVSSKLGVDYYNDTTATTPEAVIAAIKSFEGGRGKVILIAGGKDKGLKYKALAGEIKRGVKALILLRDETTTATEKLSRALGKVKIPLIFAGGMKEAIVSAKQLALPGEKIILSPGAASFGMFRNEFDRGDQFNKIVRKP